jgi:predicted outer membrane repeat protein
MNRKERRAQGLKPASNQRRAVLAGITVTGLAFSSFGIVSPVMASGEGTYSYLCSDLDSLLDDLATNSGGTVFLEYTGTCLVHEHSIGPGLTAPIVINGPSSGTLTLNVASGSTQFIFDQATHDLTLSNLSITAEDSGTQLGTIVQAWAGAHITLDNVNIHDAYTTSGAIWVEGHLDISDSSFANLSSPYNSSAISTYVGYAPVITIANSTFTNNSGTAEDGAIGVNSPGILTVTDSTFSGNSLSNNATLGGAAITLHSGATGTVSSSTFENNTSAGLGGALYSEAGGTLTVADSEFNSNTAATSGGAIYSEGSLTASSSTFFANQATLGLGGAISMMYNPANVRNSTFVNNTANEAGALFAEGGQVSNSTFWNNINTTSGAGSGSIEVNGATMFANILATDNSTPVVGTSATDAGANLYTDSSFTSTTTGVGASKQVTLESLKLQALTLNTTAPVNTGTAKTVALGTGSSAIDYFTSTSPGISPNIMTQSGLESTTDERGVARPQNGKYDVGAYEVGAVNTPPTPKPTPKPTSQPSLFIGHKTILFHGNSSKLTAQAKRQLRALVVTAIAHKVHNVRLDGHTATLTKADPSGRKLRGRLAGARTRAVEKFLKSEFKKARYSVSITRVIKGAADPAKSNRTENGRKANRRVSITFQ